LYYPTTNIHFPVTPHERFKGATEAGVYGDFVAEFDWAVGEILETLDRLDLTKNTILIITSDNGARPMAGMNGHQCNGPWRGTKRTIYEAGHRVPLVIRWHGNIRPGSTSDETVTLMDFIRTFATMLDHKLPCNAGEDSYDLTPVLLEKSYDKPLREATVHHSVNGTFAIRQGNWKLIEGAGDGDYELPNKLWRKNIIEPGFPERDPASGEFLPLMYNLQMDPSNSTNYFQLYNLEKDPTESNDLAKEHEDVVKRLKKLLNQYRDNDRSVK
jgi:arylsulfatase A